MEEYLIIDAHSHLWLTQDTEVDGQPIHSLESNPSRSLFFGEERQMLPPFMIDGRNTAEVFLSNMDYAQVSSAVVVQEIIDGNQNSYLRQVESRYPARFLCCGMPQSFPQDCTPEELSSLSDFKAIAIPAHRYTRSLFTLLPLFKSMEGRGQILSICLSDDASQIAEMLEIIRECPMLKIAIGHFGMVTRPHWEEQVKLAANKNVMIESGGITWLYNDEFYPYPSAMKAIRHAADLVGMDKLMWGSDYPRTITAITYRMSYDFIIKSSLLTTAEKRLFLGENALRFYGFQNPQRLPYIKNMSE